MNLALIITVRIKGRERLFLYVSKKAGPQGFKIAHVMISFICPDDCIFLSLFHHLYKTLCK